MRDSVIDLFKNTLVYQYDLPNDTNKIEKTIYTADLDQCFSSLDDNNLISLIYNGILEYSYGSEEIEKAKAKNIEMDVLIANAPGNKFKFLQDASYARKLSFGFYGEVLLYLMLKCFYGVDALISRGYFFDILEQSETKGYDAFHFILKKNELNLWFGEAKFYQDYENAIKSVMKNIEKALSDTYLCRNVKAFIKYSSKLENKNTLFSQLLDEIEFNSTVNIIELIKKYKMSLIYPVLIVANNVKSSYDECIRHFVDHIKEKYPGKKLSLTIPYKIFFIFLPLQDVLKVKAGVLSCMENKQMILV